MKEINTNKAEVEKLAVSENENLIKLNEESKLKTLTLNNLSSNEAKYRAILNTQKIQREELNKSIENIIIDRLKNSSGSLTDTEKIPVRKTSLHIEQNFRGLYQKDSSHQVSGDIHFGHARCIYQQQRDRYYHKSQ